MFPPVLRTSGPWELHFPLSRAHGDRVLLTRLCCRSLDGYHRKLRIFQGSLGLPVGVERSRIDTLAPAVRTRRHFHTRQASHHTLMTPVIGCGLLRPVVVRIQLAGSASLWPVGLRGSTQWGDRQPCCRKSAGYPRWEDVMTLCSRAAGTRAFKKLRKQPVSRRWLHWRRAHPGLAVKQPNCLLQSEKATSCHRPCSGRNVSGLTVPVRAV